MFREGKMLVTVSVGGVIMRERFIVCPVPLKLHQESWGLGI